MKRIRKMTSLQDITEKMIRENKNSELEQHLIQGMPARIFGETVAQKIQEMRIEGDKLLLCVPDPDWRRLLEKDRLTLLKRARTLKPGIRRIALVKAFPNFSQAP